MIPIDFVGEIGSDLNMAVIEMHDAGVLACSQAQGMCLFRVLQVQGAIEVIDDSFGQGL